MISLAKTKTGETTVTTQISNGQIENRGFGLAAELDVNIPGFVLIPMRREIIWR